MEFAEIEFQQILEWNNLVFCNVFSELKQRQEIKMTYLYWEVLDINGSSAISLKTY